jgi:hypothetical protein
MTEIAAPRSVIDQPKVARKHGRLGPHSRFLSRGSLDRRSREGRFLAACRAELAAHLGGTPSTTQKVLIERCAWLRLYLALLDEERIAKGAGLTDHDQYLAYSNALVRAMRELGVKGVAEKPSLAAHLARRAAERAVA